MSLAILLSSVLIIYTSIFYVVMEDDDDDFQPVRGRGRSRRRSLPENENQRADGTLEDVQNTICELLADSEIAQIA